jgi:LPPG:FO 2-phospho-L-lactate transferase
MTKGLVVALSGGIGGAKLALGLSRVLPPEELLVVGNTGDDFEHLGLHVSPDLDTLMYVLAGLDNPEMGWGRRDETWSFMASIGVLGGEDWFRLGDRDLATHVERTRRLRGGETLSQITADFCQRLGVGTRLLPMSDDAVRTRIRSDGGWIDFQDWFVRQQCQPVVHELAFDGASRAQPQPALLAALQGGGLRAVVICPSNPLISVGPILAIPGLREAIAGCGAPVVAVSPIIGGQAVKGPTATMLRDLGTVPSAAAVARHYGSLLQGYVMEPGDDATGIAAQVTRATTLMRTLQNRDALAHAVLDAADRLRG